MEEQQPRVNNKRWIIIIVGSFIAMLVITVVWFVLSQPATGKIITAKTGSTVKTSTSSSMNTLSATHFKLEYDSQLDTLSDVSKDNSGAEEAYRLSGGQRVLAVSVRRGSAISEESSYRLRQTQPELYKESTALFGGKEYTLMKKTDGTEVVAITVGEGKYVVIAYTLRDPLGNLTREMDAILASFRWQ